jgi:divalent metal cation (Fe/Co/Zn/Cd) transporter
MKTSIELFIETNVALMDGVKDTSIYKQIIHAVELVPGAMNPHRIRSRQLGNLYMIGLDIEVDGNLPLYEAHEIAQEVEESIKKNIENIYDIIVHVEPAGIEQTKKNLALIKTNCLDSKLNCFF